MAAIASIINRPARRNLPAIAKGPSTTTLVNCPFTAADGTLLAAYPWSDPADVRPGSEQWTDCFVGTLKTVSNRAIITAFTGAYSGAHIETGKANVVITAVIKTRQHNAFLVGVNLRYSAGAFWFVGYFHGVGLCIVENASVTRASQALTLSDAEHTFVVTANGNAISCECEGTTVSYSSSVGATNTKHGIYETTSSNNWDLDSIYCTSIKMVG